MNENARPEIEVEKITPELIKALSSFQSEIRLIKKDGNNPHFRSTYSTLAALIDAIREPLTKNGMAITSYFRDGLVITTLWHESGGFIRSLYQLQGSYRKDQEMGSSITYAKRYNIAALLNLASEDDDDGESAPGKSPQGKRPAPTQSIAQRRKVMVNQFGLHRITEQEICDHIKVESIDQIQEPHFEALRAWLKEIKANEEGEKTPG